MATIINPQDMTEVQSDEGWVVRTVVDAAHLGAPAMVAKWWVFQPGAQGPAQTRRTSDEMLYVIRGTGKAIVDGKMFDLDEESVLWLEERETYYVIAGDSGLEILQGYAPGEPANG